MMPHVPQPPPGFYPVQPSTLPQPPPGFGPVPYFAVPMGYKLVPINSDVKPEKVKPTSTITSTQSKTDDLKESGNNIGNNIVTDTDIDEQQHSSVQDDDVMIISDSDSNEGSKYNPICVDGDVIPDSQPPRKKNRLQRSRSLPTKPVKLPTFSDSGNILLKLYF
jgi:hypothetical protein